MKANGRLGALHPKFIAGIGGSAGALNAYKALLDALPPGTGMAFVIIYHINLIANSTILFNNRVAIAFARCLN